MQDFPDEIISEIITHLDFFAVNSFARSCQRHARLAAKSALQIADKYVWNSDDNTSDSAGNCVDINSRYLPNLVPHGRINFRYELGSGIFRIDYVLGVPTYWRAIDDDGCAEWGYAMSPYYIEARNEDDFPGSLARMMLTDNMSARCYRHDKTIIYGPAELLLGHDCVIDTPSPASFVVDGDINLAEVEAWGGRVFQHMRSTWPDVKLTNHIIRAFDGEPKILKAILENCPGIDAMFT